MKLTNEICISFLRGSGWLYNHDKEITISERNKAIDDFVEKAIKVVYEANNRDRNQKPRDMVADIHYKLLEIAEQLKAGGKE